MSSLGTYLRDLRARRGASLEEVARHSRVAPRYLASLEADQFDELPAPVFARGFVRAYCQALGHAPDEALRLWDSRPGVPPPPPRIAVGARAEPDPRTRTALVVSFGLLVILGAGLLAAALLIRPGAPGRLDQRAAALPASREPAPRPEPTSTPVPATPPLQIERAPEGAVGDAKDDTDLGAAAGGLASPYRLVARTSEATWIRVRTEDGRSSEETVPAGEVREWVSDRPFTVTVGNAGGVTFELNGRTLPVLGARGAVVSRVVLPPEGQ
jgi:cytoskeletal protein RodZ